MKRGIIGNVVKKSIKGIAVATAVVVTCTRTTSSTVKTEATTSSTATTNTPSGHGGAGGVFVWNPMNCAWSMPRHSEHDIRAGRMGLEPRQGTYCFAAAGNRELVVWGH
ncbi:hypothetical protein K438DRAFT_1999107 [Mycena galopus ATCC 62051]|nr:hypothetical protein K438DRAFT_1999107 [Mycena galopus ATCC 62051]